MNNSSAMGTLKYVLNDGAPSAQPKESLYKAKVVGFKPMTKNVKLEVVIEGLDGTFTKVYEPELIRGSVLHDDVLKILGREFTPEETAGTLDLNALVRGRQCSVVLKRKLNDASREPFEVAVILPAAA